MRASPLLLLLAAAVSFIEAGCTLEKIPSAKGGDFASAPLADATAVGVAPELTLDPTLLQAPSEPYRLGPGDKLEIEVMGSAGSQATTTVGPDGKIYYDLLSGIDVWGLTLSETRDRIIKGLQTYLRDKPVVSISLRTAGSRQVWILGRVGVPGVYSLAGPTTLIEAVAEAGGLASTSTMGALAASMGINNVEGSVPEAADLERSFVIRNGKTLPIDFRRLLRDGDLSQNIYLQPGDLVYFPSTGVPEVHILGAVAHPQSTRLAGPLTAVEAIAIAGGAAPGAYLKNVAIVRGSLTRPKIAIVDVGSVLHGQSPDVRLEAGDIVFVPTSPYATLSRYANLVLDIFARTVGVNAGSHAAGSGSNATIGVSVSP